MDNTYDFFALFINRSSLCETMDNGLFEVPTFTYQNFPRREGLTVEQALPSLGRGVTADMGVQVPETLIDDCVRL